MLLGIIPRRTYGISAPCLLGPIEEALTRQGSCVLVVETHEVLMTQRSPVPAFPAFEAIAQRAQFRDRIAIVVEASSDAIFQALHQVALDDMKLAWLLGELRYLPTRLAGRI